LHVLKSGTMRFTVVPERLLASADDARLAAGLKVAEFSEPDTLIGAESALAGHAQATLIAASGCTAVEIPIETRGIMGMISDNPPFGVSLARVLARRLMAANKALSTAQRQASRYLRDFQGMCVDFYNVVQGISEAGAGDDEVLQALNTARRGWAYAAGEAAGAELARHMQPLIERVTNAGRAGKDLAAGDYLCRKGDAGGSVYLLLSGRLSVRIGNEIFGVVRPGESVGELGVLLGEEEPRRMADIVADVPSVCAVVANIRFVETVCSQPRMLVNLCRMLTLRVRQFEQLAAETDDPLVAVASRFQSERGSFEQDASELRRRIEMLLNEQELPLQPYVDAASELSAAWTKRMAELQEKASATQAD
jgi:CRP-like cAMP-binding protein